MGDVRYTDVGSAAALQTPACERARLTSYRLAKNLRVTFTADGTCAPIPLVYIADLQARTLTGLTPCSTLELAVFALYLSLYTVVDVDFLNSEIIATQMLAFEGYSTTEIADVFKRIKEVLN